LFLFILEANGFASDGGFANGWVVGRGRRGQGVGLE
jgi:hypothetical protein